MDVLSPSSLPTYDKASSALDKLNAMDIKPKKKMSLQQIQAASQEFESVFLSQMLEHMFSDVKFDSEEPDSENNDVYRSMTLEQYAKTMAKAGGIGVADYVTKQMLQYQETAPTQAGGNS